MTEALTGSTVGYPQQVQRGALLTDLLRVVALGSAVVAAPYQPAEASIRFVLIFLLLLVTKAIRAPRPFEAAFAALLLASGWSSALNWYFERPWIDIPIHFALTGATGAMLYFGLLRLDLLPTPERLTAGRGVGVVTLPVTLLGGTVALVWEIYEWFAATYLPSRILVGYEDTIGDMTNGLLGSVVAGLALAAWLHAGHGLGGARPRAVSETTRWGPRP